VTPHSRDLPRAEYARRLDQRVAACTRLEARDRRLADLRLAVFAAAILLAWGGRTGACSWAWLLLPLGAFVALVIAHARTERAARLAQRAVRVYRFAVARVHDRWAGMGAAGERFRDLAHPYAEDLDLFGRGGLFELLSTAHTRRGEETLAAWLLAPAEPDAVRARQAAVEELRPRTDFREDLQVLADEAGAGLEPEALVRWAEEPPALPTGAERGVAFALACAAVVGAVLWERSGLGVPFFVVLAAEAVFAFRLRQGVKRVAAGVERAARDLEHLSLVLARLEREPFAAPRLVELRRSLDVSGDSPSRRLAALRRLAEMLESADSILLRLIGPPLLYTTQVAFALEAWRRANGPAVRRWLDAVGEAEALAALSGYAYENPADPFPELVENGPRFAAEGLGHPLLPEAGCVRNDLRLGDAPRALLVSGSNMSGKSTLLRSAGTAAVMAGIGAPVRARGLRISPLAVGATLRVTDSLQGGTSRFYAEITRLRKLFDLAGGKRPLFFLLDELLAGTNSHDRRIGAEGLVRGLIERGAIGLVTTHDLALAGIAEALAPRAANVHFEDQLEKGVMRFDYVMRPGVVTKSNALELMRSVGLEV